MRLLIDRREDMALDFNGRDPEQDLRSELSAVAAEGGLLWTGSDEGRGVECFEHAGDRLLLSRRLKLDRLFPGLPKKGEADLEALDFRDGRLWLTGSHCVVRPKGRNGEPSGAPCQAQPSRRLLGSVRIGSNGKPRRKTARALPFKGKRSLRGVLKRDKQIAPFLKIPTKENGLDVEGIVATEKSLFLGLRGPVIATRAVLLEFPLKTALRKPGKKMRKHLLDLGGLGVRDLGRRGEEILILAGPVTSTGGPFRLFRWDPKRKSQEPEPVHQWKLKDENPEGVCFLEREGRPGVLMLYDNPTERVSGSVYHADWFPLDA
jgi:hypothetical protein